MRLWTTDGKEVALPKDLQKETDDKKEMASPSSDGRLMTARCDSPSAKPSMPGVGMRGECTTSYRGSVHSLSNDGEWVLTSADTVAYLEGGKAVHTFDQGQGVDFMALSDDDALLLTGSLQDDIVHLWDVKSGSELCRMVIMKSGTWVVFDKYGQFDTDDIEGIHGLNWIMPTDRMRPLPLEIFMRDYFTPGLLSQQIEGKAPTVGPVSAHDTITPHVIIDKITLEASRKSVTLRLALSLNRSDGEGSVLDLHVFRDGKLVARIPEDGGALDAHLDHGYVTVSNIQVPTKAPNEKVEFSAYAFNKEHIKGETTKRSFEISEVIPPQKPTAYILTFGVNVFEDPAWNLRFAANDARQMSSVLYDSLAKTTQFGKIIRIPFVADTEHRSGELPATKKGIQAALAELSGKSISSGSELKDKQLNRAAPEDLVVIHIATHGYTDEDGVFYMLPSDIGSHVGSTLSSELKAASISSNDLTSWLMGVDASEIILILDTCQAAAVAGQDFKPGPMGDRGFGQLVYDKRIRLLVGSQADSVALEVDRLQHGLLSYALVRDGLGRERADFDPKDNSITISEWLQYGISDVIRIQGLINAGQSLSQTPGGEEEFTVKRATIFGTQTGSGQSLTQRPILFDFGKTEGPVVWGQPFFDPSSVRKGSDPRMTEFQAAADVPDPIASAAALKRFIVKQKPGGATAAAWTLVVGNLLKGEAASVELISACRLALAHLALVGDSGTAAKVVASVADELQRRHDFPEVLAEFRAISDRIKGR
jgi:hypothetical protein